jgi:hypothetical protein
MALHRIRRHRCPCLFLPHLRARNSLSETMGTTIVRHHDIRLRIESITNGISETILNNSSIFYKYNKYQISSILKATADNSITTQLELIGR